MHNAIVEFNANGAFNERNRSGRPRKTIPREDCFMRHIVIHSPKLSYKNIRAILKRTAIRSSTISKRLTGHKKRETGRKRNQTYSPLDVR